MFCDLSGTLFNDESWSINKEILSELEKLEEQGYRITLWTGGNIDLARKDSRYRELGERWALVPKLQFKYTAVEVAIDDEMPGRINYKYAITAKKYIRVGKVFVKD